MPHDGTFYDPNQKDYVGIPPKEVKYWPNEENKAEPGGHTPLGPRIDSEVQDARILPLVQRLIGTFKKVINK